MKAKDQVNKAAELGAAAYHKGVKCAPCLDPELLGMFGSRSFTTPEGEASTVKLLESWTRTWTQESLKAARAAIAA